MAMAATPTPQQGYHTSPKTRQLSTEALTLRAMDYKEADRIASLYTRQQGRVDVILKGVRKKANAQSAVSQTLTLTRVLYTPSKTHGLASLQQAQSLEAFAALKANLWGLSLASLAAEWVLASAEGTAEQASDTFDLLLHTLLHWDETLQLEGALSTAAGLLPLLQCQAALLKTLGLWPQLHQCVLSQQPLVLHPGSASLRFALSHGGCLHPSVINDAQVGSVLRSTGKAWPEEETGSQAGRTRRLPPAQQELLPISASTLLALRLLEAGELAALHASLEHAAVAKKVLRFLNFYFEHRWGSTLKSQQLALDCWPG
jgi:DNA repair protein RecO